MSALDTIFAWVGGISITVLLLVGAVLALAWSKDRIWKRYELIRRRSSHHGPLAGIRYTLAIRLLLPYLERRYHELTTQREDAAERDNAKTDDQWGTVRNNLVRADARLGEFMSVVRCDGGMIAERHKLYWGEPEPVASPSEEEA